MPARPAERGVLLFFATGTMKKKATRNDPDRMICGKRRRPMARSSDVQAIEVDGVSYTWAQRHGWVIWGKGLKAVSISVVLDAGRTRELILDFTIKVDDRLPTDARMVGALESAIRAAQQAGWDPESRGRAFRYENPESL